jgi:hypothetical protein
VLVTALLVPNVIMYNFVTYYPHASHLGQAQVSLFSTQQLFILGSMFCTMFGHKMTNISNSNDILDISLEERTIYFLMTFLVAKIFFVVAEICEDSSTIQRVFLPLWYIFAIAAVLQIYYILYKILPFLWKQSYNGKFKSHTQMSDFLHLSTIFLFITSIVIAGIVTGRWISPSASETTTGALTSFLYIQVVLTYILTAIPGRCYLLLSKNRLFMCASRMFINRPRSLLFSQVKSKRTSWRRG